jgi:predicted  nucleic acid-binding Zn ribbon protein
MILHKVIFGAVAPSKREEACEAAERYLGHLAKNGQAEDGYSLATQMGRIVAYVFLQGIQAHLRRYHSLWGRKELKKVAALFGAPPRWTVAEDDPPTRDTTWANAPFLYLFTHMLKRSSPIGRADNGRPIPVYRLPVTDADREGIGHWESLYRRYDFIWFECNSLEIRVYKELADPFSELSREGLAICRTVEEATGVPTYYFLLRYWGRRKGEEKRRCPGCGRTWRTKHPLSLPGAYHLFAFQCHRCRLVSHAGNSLEDERRARIGECHKRRIQTRNGT